MVTLVYRRHRRHHRYHCLDGVVVLGIVGGCIF